MWHRDFSSDGGDVHDSGVSAHVAKCLECRFNHSPEIDLHDFAKLVLANDVQWRDFHDPGVVDENIDATKPLHHRLNENTNPIPVSEIAFVNQNFAVVGKELLLCDPE